MRCEFESHHSHSKKEIQLQVITDKGYLYIEPSGNASDEPVIDSITQKMTAAFNRAVPVEPFLKGVHVCYCGTFSTGCNYKLPNGKKTNSLCVHYLAWHRKEVPQEQLAKVADLSYGEEVPSPDRLKAPTLRRTR